MEELTKEIKEFLNKKIFLVSIILTAIASYGFAITHESIGIDDLCLDRYIDGTLFFPPKRWGIVLLYKLLGIREYTPFWLEFMVTIIFVITAICLCSIIKSLAKDKISDIAYILGACSYISFPILMYQFTYQPTNLSVAISNLVMLIAVYGIYKNCVGSKKKLNYVIWALVLGISIAMYEACLQTYIVFTFFLLLLHLKYVDSKAKFVDIMYIGIILAIEMFVGIFIHQGIGSLICIYISYIGELPKNFAFHKSVFTQENPAEYVRDLFWYMFKMRGNAMSLFRSIIILFLGVSIFDAIKSKEWKIIFLNIGIICSNLLLLFLVAMVLLRSYYSWAITVGIAVIYIYDVLQKAIKVKHIEKVLCIICMFLILYESKMTNQLFYEDYLDTQYMKNLFINQMANTIMEKSLDYNNKKIIVLRRKTGEKVFKSKQREDLLLWFSESFDEPGEELVKYLNHFGYNFKNGSKEDYENYFEDFSQTARKHNDYVAEGDKYIYLSLYY